MHRGADIVATVRIALLSLTMIFVTQALFAGDEDMSPSAYHVFDPETGYMMTVDPMDEEQLDTALPAGESADVDTNGTTVLADEQAAGTTPALLWAYLIVGIIVVVGALTWKRGRVT